MKPAQTAKAATIALALTLIFGMLSRATAEADEAGPLQVFMTMTSPVKVALGEPITIHYVLRNTSPTEVVIAQTGAHNSGWYQLRLTDASEQSQVASDPRSSFSKREGLHQTGDRAIGPNDSFEGDIVVSRLMKPAHPGDFVVLVRVPLRYATRPNLAFVKQGQVVPTSQFEVMQDFSFPLVVTPTDPVVLQMRAEMLRHSLMDAANSGQWSTLTEELFSLPEPEALPSWERLITDEKTDTSVLASVADQLAYLGTPTAADLLGDIAVLQTFRQCCGGRPCSSKCAQGADRDVRNGC